ncbi:MAG: CD225/dispanin family protein [Prevotella sp.]|nr:CD225/dispanin family protein [Prevotella sp.]
MENYQNQNAGGPVQMPVKDNKVLAIVALVLSILCCNIFAVVFAIIAMVKSNEVGKYQMMGQQALAEQSGKRAGLFSWIAIALLVFGLIMQYVWLFAMGGMEMYQQMLQNMQ